MTEKSYDALEDVRCPACGEKAGLENCDTPDAVTYWAEDGPIEAECLACSSTLTLHEHVTRWWHVASDESVTTIEEKEIEG